MPIRTLTPMMRSHTLVRQGCVNCSTDSHSIDKQKLDSLQKNEALEKAVKDEKFRILLLKRPALAARLLRNKLPLSVIKKLRSGELSKLRRELMDPPAITLANGCSVKPKVNLRITLGDEQGNSDLGGLTDGNE